MSILSFLFGYRSKQPTVSFEVSEMELFVEGWNDSELRQIISDFQHLDSDQPSENFSTEIHAGPGWFLRVTFPTGIEPDRFCFLINYTQYPRKFDLKSREILVAGKATISSDFLQSDQSLIGERMLLYVPSNDRDYDVIYAQVRGQGYKFPFSSGHWERVEDPRMPEKLGRLQASI